MKPTELLRILFSMLLLLPIMGCTSDDESEPSIHTEEYETQIFESTNNVIVTGSIDDINQTTQGIPYDVFVNQASKTTTRSSSGSGVLKAVGYTNTTKLKTGKYMFRDLPNTSPLQNYTYYPYTRFIFGNRVTIPHGATIIIPSTVPSNFPIGWNPDDLSKAGYRYFLISQSSNGDIYELQTVIDVIEYNVSGQKIGKYYVPNRVGDPSIDMYFEYAWQQNNWFE